MPDSFRRLCRRRAGVGAIAWNIMSPAVPPRRTTSGALGGALLDFCPVFRNRRTVAWIAGYTVHTWELAALRAWGVTFPTAAAALHGEIWWIPGPTVLFTTADLAGITVSVLDNKIAQRRGRMKPPSRTAA